MYPTSPVVFSTQYTYIQLSTTRIRALHGTASKKALRAGDKKRSRKPKRIKIYVVRTTAIATGT